MRRTFINIFRFCQEIKPFDIKKHPPNIITRQLMACKSKENLNDLLDQYADSFNLINLSSFFNKYSMFRNQESKNFEDKIIKTVEETLKREIPQNQANHRAMLNMLFYVSRLGELGHKLTDLLLQYDISKCIVNPKSKQCMMTIVGLCRMKRQKEVRQLIPTIRDQILNDKDFETTHIVQIWENLIRNGYSDPKTDDVIDRVLKSKDHLPIQDFTYMITCYSMIDKSMIDPTLVKKLKQYPKISLISIKNQELTMLCRGLQILSWIDMPTDFKQTLANRFKAIFKFCKLNHVAVIFQYLSNEVATSRALLKEIQNLLYGCFSEEHKQPVRFDSWVLIAKTLVDIRHEVNTKEMQNFVLKSLTSKSAPVINVEPRHMCIIIAAIAQNEHRNDSYQPSLAFQSAVSSYIVQNIKEFSQEQLIMLAQCSRKVTRSKEVCQQLYKHIKNIENEEAKSVLARPCILNKQNCLNCISN